MMIHDSFVQLWCIWNAISNELEFHYFGNIKESCQFLSSNLIVKEVKEKWYSIKSFSNHFFLLLGSEIELFFFIPRRRKKKEPLKTTTRKMFRNRFLLCERGSCRHVFRTFAKKSFAADELKRRKRFDQWSEKLNV